MLSGCILNACSSAGNKVFLAAEVNPSSSEHDRLFPAEDIVHKAYR